MTNPTADKIIVTGQIPLTPADTWRWLTMSDLTARWFGPFRFEGERLFVTLIQEDSQPEMEGRVLAKQTNERLTLKLGTDESAWVIDLLLEPSPGGTLLRLEQAATGSSQDRWISAGWHFYFDCLLAAIKQQAMPLFEDYAPHTEDS